MNLPFASKVIARALVLPGLLCLTLPACQDDDGSEPKETQGGPEAPVAVPDQALGPGSNTAPREGEMTVTIPFSAQIDGKPIVCGQRYPGVSQSNSEIEFEEFAIYVHNVELRNAQGAWVALRMQDDGRWQSQSVALLDFLGHESAACAAQGTQDMHTFVSGYLPQGEYSGLRFVLGVPGELNHIDASQAVAPFNRQRMWWTWSRGYRYLKADIKAWTTGADGKVIEKERYFSHTGADKCALDPATQSYRCEDPRLVSIELEHNLATNGVLIDLKKYYARDRLDIGRGCMGTKSIPDKNDPKDSNADSCLGHYLSIGLDPSGEVATPTGQQDLFASVPWAGLKPVAPEHVPLSRADTPEGRSNIAYWPRKDYVRPPLLDGKPSQSEALKRDSHAFDDPRAFESCANCHQQYGPGDSQFSFAGTLFREDGSPYNEGFVEIVSSQGKGNRREPDPSKKLVNPVVHMRVPVDAYGQFYATQDLAVQWASQNNVAPMDFRNKSYQAFVVNRDGHRVQAMAVNTTGSCNHCHTGGFKLVVPNRLHSGPWTPEAGQ